MLEVKSQELEQWMKRLGDDIVPLMSHIMQYQVLRLQGEVRAEIDKRNLVDTGEMREAVDTSVDTISVGNVQEVIGRIFNDISATDAKGGVGYYALAQHQGFRKFVPFNVSPRLYEWAVRHDLEVKPTGGLWVGKGLGQGQPFMRDVAERNSKRIVEAFLVGLRSLIGRGNP
jgi:hypothetical protein